jgi:hypothetical protein
LACVSMECSGSSLCPGPPEPDMRESSDDARARAGESSDPYCWIDLYSERARDTNQSCCSGHTENTEDTMLKVTTGLRGL